MNLEYDKGFVDALDIVLDLANKHKEKLVEKIGDLWIVANDKKVERIKRELGFIDFRGKSR
jgi:hypothetical protein